VLPGPSLLRFLPPRTQLRRVPLFTPTAFATVADEGCHTLAGAVLRVLAPLDGSGCVRGTHGPLRGPPLSVTPRRFAAFFHAARVPRSRPPELSLPGEPHPLSRAVASLRVRGRPPPTRRTRDLRARFPHSAGPVAARGPEAPGRLRGRESAFPRSLRSDKSELFRLRPPDQSLARRDSPVDAAVTPAAKLCSPRESVPATPHPGRVKNEGPVLSWALSSPEPAPERSWVRSLACDPGQAEPGHRTAPEARPSRSRGETRASTPGPRSRDPPARWLRNHRDHRQAATRRSPRSRRVEPLVASRTHHPGRGSSCDVRPAPPFGGAPCLPRPRPPPPARGDGDWTSETHWKDRAGGPPSREGDQLS
jgi:hypothetical protein